MGAIATIAVLAAGCAAGKAFRQGEAAVHGGDLDQAVVYYRKAAQAAPDNANYKIALERTLLAASRSHLDKARDFESKDQLEAALGEYRLANEYDPSNRLAGTKVAALERTIRERADAARLKPAIRAMRARARASEPALINLTTPLPLIKFQSTSIRQILDTIGSTAGINVTYERTFQDRPTSIQLDGATLEQALNQIMATNELSYKVLNDRTIFVFPDNAQAHGKYDEQVVRTFYLSHVDAVEANQLLSTMIRLPGIAVQPAIIANKTTNSVTVRAGANVVGIIEKIIDQIDKPRAELVIDVEILEVDRSRAKTYGLDLSEYAAGLVFSPEVSPSSTTSATPGTGTGTTPTTGTGTTTPTSGTTTTNTGSSTAPSGVKSPPPFNLNTISRGVTTADFYLAVPTAIMHALESDTHTKVVAKPNLRGAEGTKLEFIVGQQIPVVSTSYTPIATGGAGVNPLSSYQYKDVGVKIQITPRVTVENDIILDLYLEDNQRGADVPVAGVTVPSFVTRQVTTRLRLRDGESNLLAGLLQQNEQTSITGFPGAIHLPVLSQLFSHNNNTNDQLEIVMMLTPHIIRSQEITEADLKPVYIGSSGSLGVGGPPPLIVPPQVEQPAPAPAPGTPPGYIGPGGVAVMPPPGSTPVPGTVLAPPPTPTLPPPAVVTPPTEVTGAIPNIAPPATTNPAAVAPVPQPVPETPPATPETTTSPGLGAAQVIITPPGTAFRVGGGPYTVPISIVNASRLSTVTLTVTFDPERLRVRSVQEGSFMRTGGVNVSFAHQEGSGRVDITISRGADATGAGGTGLLAAVLFDAVAPGSATLSLSGSATGPGGTPMGLQFRPVTVTIQQ
jgi:general secretion pathway protein D